MKYLLWFKHDDGSITTVSEYKESKNLEEFVKDFKKENQELKIPEDIVFFIFGRIIGALKALYDSFKVCHRDLKPENILISANYEPLIIDFGSAL